MKKIYALLFLALFVDAWTLSYTQDILNPGFEQWTQTDGPDFWTTSNEYTSTIGSGTGVNKDAQLTEGSNSASMITLGVGFAGQPYAAYMINGTPDVNKATGFPDYKNSGGTPLTKKPTALTGSYKYTQNFPNDSGQVFVILKSKGAQVGYGSLNFAHTNNAKTFRVEISDLAPGTDPDTIVIAFFSTNPINPIKNGRLWVDDLALDFATGIEDPKPGFISNVFPNPTNDALTIEILEIPEEGVLNIFSSTGKLVYKSSMNGLQTRIDVSGFGHGVYFYSISDKGIKRAAGNFLVR